jgi:hypothetical protein
MKIQSLIALSSILWTIGSFEADAAPGSQIQILSATIRDQAIADATVIVQKNGEQSSATMTDAKGNAQVGAVASDPSSLLIVRRIGYSDLVAKCPCAGMTYALSPTMQKLDGMRIVLNWGAHPDDLDGHLAFPGNHIWFNHQKGADADLDVDHINGFGPETITISRKHAGERYIYAVQDFSDKMDPGTTRLAESDAKVFVYVGQTLIKTYYVPSDKVGNVWTVFSVSAEGEIQDINSMSRISVADLNAITAEAVFGADFGGSDRVADPTPAVVAIPANARRVNVAGESAYRAGNYPEAIRLFRSAVELDGSYGQAYSNLGLAFQKAGRVAEALWANRKAIALASGPQAAITRASTHFNNGRIYEDAQQWSDALREFSAAEVEKDNPVYVSAAARMREHTRF